MNDAGYDQTLNGKKNFLDDVSDDGPQHDIDRYSLEMTCDENRRLYGDFFQARFNSNGPESTLWIASSPETDLKFDSTWNIQCARSHEFHGNGTVKKRRLLFCRLEPVGEHIEEKAGRHIDDILMTGLKQNAERFSEAGKRHTEHARCSSLVQNR